MKHPFLLATIFTLSAISADTHAETTRVIREVGYVLPASVKTVSCSEARELAPVAARVSRASLTSTRPTYSGILPRIATSSRPVEQFSPLAPRRDGAGWNLVSFANHDPYRSVTPRLNHPQATGLRLLGIRGIW